MYKKRLSSLFLVLTLIASLALISLLSCKKKEAALPEDWPKEITFAANNHGSTTYVLAVKLCDIITRYTGVTATASPTGGTGESLQLLISGDADMAFLSSYAVYDAYRGLGKQKDTGKVPLWQIMRSHTNVMCYMVRKDSDIKTPADFRGKRFAYHLSPSPLSIGVGQDLLECNGMTTKDVNVQKIARLSDGDTALKEGTTDIAIRWIGATGATPGVQELAETVGIRLISLTEKDVECMRKKRGFYVSATIEPGRYKGQDEPLNLIGHSYLFTISRKLPDSLVYEMTKAIFEHIDEFYEVHAAAKEIKLTNAVTAIGAAGVSPGAVKYYKEKGIWGDNEETQQKAVLAEIGM